MRYLKEEDIERIAIGAAVLGSGGGGDPYVGKLMAKQAIRAHGPVRLVSVDELDDGALVIPSAAMGAPSVMLEKLPNGDEPERAFRGLEKILGRKAEAVISIEAGGLNSCIPIYTAACLGLPLVDGDGMGRVFPELPMVSFSVGGVSASPHGRLRREGQHDGDPGGGQPVGRGPLAHGDDRDGALLDARHLRDGRRDREAARDTRHHVPGGLDRRAHPRGRRLDEERRRLRPRDHEGLPPLRGQDRRRQARPHERLHPGDGGLRGPRLLRGEDLHPRLPEREPRRLDRRRARSHDARPHHDPRSRARLPDHHRGPQVRQRAVVIGMPCNPFWRSEKALAQVGPRYFKYDIDYKPIEALAGGKA